MPAEIIIPVDEPTEALFCNPRRFSYTDEEKARDQSLRDRVFNLLREHGNVDQPNFGLTERESRQQQILNEIDLDARLQSTPRILRGVAALALPFFYKPVIASATKELSRLAIIREKLEQSPMRTLIVPFNEDVQLCVYSYHEASFVNTQMTIEGSIKPDKLKLELDPEKYEVGVHSTAWGPQSLSFEPKGLDIETSTRYIHLPATALDTVEKILDYTEAYLNASKTS